MENQTKRKRCFVVIRRRDNQVVAFCDEVEDAARVIVRQSRREECVLREADVIYSITILPKIQPPIQPGGGSEEPRKVD